MKNIITITILLLLISFCFADETEQDSTTIKTKITFLELGSKTCIPCQQMEKVLVSISAKYGDQIEVIFHDVKEDKKIAAKYKIKMIPTQIFLDESGKEIHRHVGFYPEELIDEFLQKRGLKIVSAQESE